MLTQVNISQIENVTNNNNSTIFSTDFFSSNYTTHNLSYISRLYHNTLILTTQQNIIYHYKDFYVMHNNTTNNNSTNSSNDDNNNKFNLKSSFKANKIKTNSLVKTIRNGLDKPFAGLIVIGALFLTISILLGLIVLIFYKKRNTVFVYEKSQHGGLYSPRDRSIVIGQTKEARSISRRINGNDTDDNDSLYSFSNPNDTDNDNDDEHDDYNSEFIYTNTNIDHDQDDVHRARCNKSIKASYILRSEYDLMHNSQTISKLSNTCNKLTDQNEFNKFTNEMIKLNKHSISHKNHLSVNSNNHIINNPTVILCPEHAQQFIHQKISIPR
ncbi:hypothetical protein KSF78_0009141 [Schistosoma japonicum]|nr:hypothetical protein KSF78_0009141 [Schistosoma japonicum]